MKLWQRILCVIPAILFFVNLGLMSVPLTPHIEQNDSEIKLYWSNFVYDYGLNTITKYLMLLSISLLAALGVTEREENAWRKAKKKRWIFVRTRKDRCKALP